MDKKNIFSEGMVQKLDEKVIGCQLSGCSD